MLHVRPTKMVKILLIFISLWKASSCLILRKILTLHAVSFVKMSHRVQKLVSNNTKCWLEGGEGWRKECVGLGLGLGLGKVTPTPDLPLSGQVVTNCSSQA